MTSSPNQIGQEIFDENSHPSEEEVLDYALKIGIDPNSEPHLLPIARDGLMHALPPQWKPCLDQKLQKWFYYNSTTGKSQWEHPLDPIYREVVKRGRSEGYSSAGDDDSKTTAKEDLKSFEEVSDMLSSKSTDIRPSINSTAKSPVMEKLKGSLFVQPQPLLARRKQIQMGHDPLQTAKVVNAAMRDKSFSNFNTVKGWSSSTLSVPSGLQLKDYKSRSVTNTPDTAKHAIQPLRRAHTLDPISDIDRSGMKRDDSVPIKGILRESSFTSLPSRNLARVEPGEFGVGFHDLEDERKRSVRFADFERKALDIKFQLSDSEESIYDDRSVSSGSHAATSEGGSPDDGLQVMELKKSGGTQPSEFISDTPMPIKQITIHKSTKPRKFEEKISKNNDPSFKTNHKTDDSDSNESQDSKSKTLSNSSLDLEQERDRVISNMEKMEMENNDNSLYGNSMHNNNIVTVEFNNSAKEKTISELSVKTVRKAVSAINLSSNYKNEYYNTYLESNKDPQDNLLIKDDNLLCKKATTESFITANSQSMLDISVGDNFFNVIAIPSENSIPEIEEPLKTQISNIEESVTYKLSQQEMEQIELKKKKSIEMLAQIEEQLSIEIQNKISELKQKQNDKIIKARELVNNEEASEMHRLRKEMDERMSTFKLDLEKEIKLKEEENRNNLMKALSDLDQKLEQEKINKIAEVKYKHEDDLNKILKLEEDKYLGEKLKIETETDQRIKNNSKLFTASVDELKAKEVAEINELKEKSAQVIDKLKKNLENAIDELEEKHKKDFKKVEEEHNISLNTLKLEKEVELRRVETEWEDKITATSLQHKASLESAISDHERTIMNLRHQFQKDEEELKKKHAEQIEAWNQRVKKVIEKEPNDITQINRDFEKMRCEKRLLEDKYRSLKDKYVQLKSDMRVAVERKLQSRARRKREENAAQITDRNDNKPIETEIKTNEVKPKISKNHNLNNSDSETPIEKLPNTDLNRTYLPKHLTVHALREGSHDNATDNDPSSTDDQYNSLSSAQATESEPRNFLSSKIDSRWKKSPRAKSKIAHRKELPGNILENVKSQLQDLEEIEERIPATAHKDTYVRYPFLGPGLGTSAEVDFYRHRVLVEQEAVRAARECLLQQKRDLEARQTILRANTGSSTMNQLQQQERDLTEMEVSIHRTRALLGEKMIRLRLLGQTLDRLVQDPSSPSQNALLTNDFTSPVSGDEAGNYHNESVPYNVLQNLENINCEIREIWAHLNKQQGSPSLLQYKGTDAPHDVLLSPGCVQKSSTSERVALEARLQELRHWLETPKQPLSQTITQLTL